MDLITITIVSVVLLLVLVIAETSYKMKHFSKEELEHDIERMREGAAEWERYNARRSIERQEHELRRKEYRARQDALRFRNSPKYEPEYKKRERERRARECPSAATTEVIVTVTWMTVRTGLNNWRC